MGLARSVPKPDVARGPHLHRISRRRLADEAPAVYDLHTNRFIYMVPRTRVRRNETRPALGRARAVFSSLRRSHRDTLGRRRRRSNLQPDKKYPRRTNLRALTAY